MASPQGENLVCSTPTVRMKTADRMNITSTPSAGSALPNPQLHVREGAQKKKPPARNWTPTNLLVIKVGTSSLMSDGPEVAQHPAFSLSNMGKLVDTVCSLRALDYQVVLVTSGAVGAGCLAMKTDKKPTNFVGKQAAAAIGQCKLMRLYEDLFAVREANVAQLLMTRTDLCDKVRYLNFKNTLIELLYWNVLPIVNENDSVACDQLRFGDNDTLAAYVAVAVGAKWLILLTDVDCLYTANPRTTPTAAPIPYVGRMDDVYKLVGGDTMGSSWGSGGMRTKIIAAKVATATGIKTALCHGKFPERVLSMLEYYEIIESRETTSTQNDVVVNGDSVCRLKNNRSTKSLHTADSEELDAEELHQIESCVEKGIGRGMEVGVVTVDNSSELPYIGTVFGAYDNVQHMQDQRRWILSLPIRGKLTVDEGAAKAVVCSRTSLFAAGVIHVEGDFFEGEVVSIYQASKEDEMAAKAERAEFIRELQHNNSTANLPAVESHPILANDSSPPLSFDGVEEDEFDKPEIARCLVNFSSNELRLVRGLRSDVFQKVLGYDCHPEVSDRSNIILVNPRHDAFQQIECRRTNSEG